MNQFTYNLLRLSLLVALTLTPGVVPIADAGVAQLAPPLCLQNPIAGKIIGTARDSNGKPLQNVNVTAHATTGTLPVYALTNAAGEYALVLQPGSYLLEFRPSQGAFQVAWYKSGASPRDATPVEVGDGKTITGLDVTLPVGAQFPVALRDPEGAPVRDGAVSVLDRFGRQVASGQTNDEGRAVTQPGLPPGTYRLLAEPPYGSPLLPQYANGKPTLEAADLFTVTKTISDEVVLSLPRGARLSGTVSDSASGAPLAGIGVRLRDAGYEVRDATTDAQGRYSIDGLPGGAYLVEFGPNQAASSAAAPLRRIVTLSAPNALSGFDAALARGGAISGRVTTAEGAPIPDASVSVRDADDAINASTTAAADGAYTLGGLPSGRYTLTVVHPDYQARALAEQISVTAPNTTTVATTALTAGGSISGKITGPDDAPVAGVAVSVLDAVTRKPQEAYATTDSTGAYTLPHTLASGSYIVKFEPPGGEGLCGLAIEYSGNGATAAAAKPVAVSAPATVTGVDAKLEYGAHIAGQITEAASGLPLYGVVWVYDSTGALATTGSVLSLGRYRTATALPPGSYRVQFVADGYVQLFYGGVTALEAAAQVPSGATDASIALPRGGTIRGRVTAGDTGAPLEHALVTLYGAGGRVLTQEPTDFDGTYRFTIGLPSGQYRIGVAPGKRDDGTPFFTGYAEVFSGGASSLDTAQPVGLVAPKIVEANLIMPLQATPPTPPTPTPQPAPGNTRVYLPLVLR